MAKREERDRARERVRSKRPVKKVVKEGVDDGGEAVVVVDKQVMGRRHKQQPAERAKRNPAPERDQIGLGRPAKRGRWGPGR